MSCKTGWRLLFKARATPDAGMPARVHIQQKNHRCTSPSLSSTGEEYAMFEGR